VATFPGSQENQFTYRRGTGTPFAPLLRDVEKKDLARMRPLALFGENDKAKGKPQTPEQPGWCSRGTDATTTCAARVSTSPCYGLHLGIPCALPNRFLKNPYARESHTCCKFSAPRSRSTRPERRTRPLDPGLTPPGKCHELVRRRDAPNERGLRKGGPVRQTKKPELSARVYAVPLEDQARR